MMNKRLVWSGLFAAVVEVLLFSFLILIFIPSFKEKYTAKDRTQIEFIEIDELISDKPRVKSKNTHIHKQAMPKSEAKPTLTPQKENEDSHSKSVAQKPSPVVGVDVKELFEKVDKNLPALEDEDIVHDDRPLFSANSIKSKEYNYEQNNQNIQAETSRLKNVLEQMWEKELEVTSPSPQDMVEGKYDQWFSEVKKILYAKWNNHFYESVAIVVNISITDEGKFSYRIIKYSKNNSYNIYMEGLLQSLTLERFPPYPKGRRADIEVVFKTKEQNNE